MKIQFVHYDGAYPNLCNGVLILRIDEEIYSFGGYGYADDPDKQFPSFWETGGSCEIDYETQTEYVTVGDWLVDEDALPEFLKPYAQQLIEIFKENVIQGCCGGCI